LRVFAREKSGVVWLGGTQGAARFDPRAKDRWERWQYFFGLAWLPDNDVKNIWIEERKPAGAAWIRTAKGVSLIEWRAQALAEKARAFDERIEKRHLRHGFVTEAYLPVAGDVTISRLGDNDNDGLWTAMYLGSQAYRYAATKDPAARKQARRALEALMRLEQITGRPGFPARSFVSKDEPKPHGGEWHPTPDGLWLWKADTSSDEIVGHYYAYALYYDLVANEGEKAEIRPFVARITDHIVQNGFRLIDLDGQPTRWGKWDEGYFATEDGKHDSALNAIQLLAFLRVAEHITGDKKYAEVARERIAKGYAELARGYRRNGGEINFSDDELAYLSYDPLLRYERDPALRAIFLDGLRFTWSQVRPDRNPLWNYISAASGAGPMAKAVREESRLALERVPMSLIQWEMKNSHRRDVTFQTATERFGKRQLTEAPAPDERPIRKWNSNPYVPDGGGNGQSEEDGTFFLLPYWMGRYHGWVK
jgi:hypothetical protein